MKFLVATTLLALSACSVIESAPNNAAASLEESLVPGICNGKSINSKATGFDLDSYLGLWYEVAHPKAFTRAEGCQCTTADYQAKGRNVKVTNVCRKDSVDGDVSVAKGIARALNADQGKFKVGFFLSFIPGIRRLFQGNYNVVAWGSDYEWAIVVSCQDEADALVWILSRDPEPEAAFLEAASEKIIELGISEDTLLPTVQKDCWNESPDPALTFAVADDEDDQTDLEQ